MPNHPLTIFNGTVEIIYKLNGKYVKSDSNSIDNTIILI